MMRLYNSRIFVSDVLLRNLFENDYFVGFDFSVDQFSG